MKKYVKPELFYENFELTQQVATCAFDINISDGCGFLAEDFNATIFTGNRACDILLSEKDAESYCYTAGADGNTLFNS